MRIASLLLITLTLMSCGETAEDNTIEKARTCTDNAASIAFTNPDLAATQAATCESMITSSGLTSLEANRIIFGALLIQQKKMSQIATMANNLKTKTSGNLDGLNTVLSVMVFNNPEINTGLTAAGKVQRAGNKMGAGAQLLGNLIMLATQMAYCASGTVDPNNASAALQACINNPGLLTVPLTDVINQLKSGACDSEKDKNSTDPNNMCFKLKSANSKCPGATEEEKLKNYLAGTCT